MARPAILFDQYRTHLLSRPALDQPPMIAVSQGGAVPWCHPRILRLTEQDADLVGVRWLRMDREPYGIREALGDNPGPSIAPLNHAIGIGLTLLLQSVSGFAGIQTHAVLDQEAQDATKEGGVDIVR
jgi:hypothetical protein